MAKKPVRDNGYYEKRLKKEFPLIYADFCSGKIRTKRQAFIAAGLMTERSRLHELKNAWLKAAPIERVEFLDWLSASGALPPRSVVAAPSASLPVQASPYLLPATLSDYEAIRLARGLEPGQVMTEMGFDSHDQSLSMAKARGTKVKPTVSAALNKWLIDNASFAPA